MPLEGVFGEPRSVFTRQSKFANAEASGVSESRECGHEEL